MTGSSAGGVLGRRRFVLTAAGSVAGASVATFASPTTIAAAGPSPAPNPIPGGLELAPGFVIHVFPAGDPTITLPFSGLTPLGFDVEPTTITDFRGSSALAYHVGRARGNDGKMYNLETDIRAFEGEYVVDGAARSGAFALI